MPKKKITALNEDFDTKLFISIAKQNFIWVIVFMLVSLLSALIYLRYTPPVFESSSVVKLANQNKANSVFDMNKTYFAEESRNQMAGDIELIRSRILAKQALAKLPLDISYYAKGTVLDQELYRTSPYNVEYLIKDSSIYGTQFFMEWTKQDQFNLSYKFNGKSYSTDYKIIEWIDLPESKLRVTLNSYNTILDQQKLFKDNAYYFTLNNSNLEAIKFSSLITVSIVNADAKTLSIKLKDFSPIKAADIVNALTSEFIGYSKIFEQFRRFYRGFQKTKQVF